MVERVHSSLATRARVAIFVFPILFLVIGCAQLLASGEGPDARIQGRTHVLLTLHDSYGLMPSDLLPGIQLELDRLFSFSDGRVSVVSGRESKNQRAAVDARHGLRVNAVVMPMDPGAWNLDASALAAVVREPGKQGAIYLFVPNFERILGASLEDCAQRRHGVVAERALGRILAHELVHLMLPGTGHSDSGLMASRLDRRFLTRTQMVMDPESMFRLSLAMWERSREALSVALARELKQANAEIAVGAGEVVLY